MQKLKDVSKSSWMGFEIEGEKNLSQIRGGLSSQTKTADATYVAQPGGGTFDTGSEDSQHESMGS